jgi:hypothetical protein
MSWPGFTSKDGDAIWLESPVRKVKAEARVTECVHPEVIGIAGNAGHWAKGKPLSAGKGVNGWCHTAWSASTSSRPPSTNARLSRCIRRREVRSRNYFGYERHAFLGSFYGVPIRLSSLGQAALVSGVRLLLSRLSFKVKAQCCCGDSSRGNLLWRRIVGAQ